MLVIDSHYLGFLQIKNTGSVLIYVKHVLVLGWIALGVYLDIGVTRRLADARAADRLLLLARFRRMNGLAAAGGVIIILVTAAVQGMYLRPPHRWLYLHTEFTEAVKEGREISERIQSIYSSRFIGEFRVLFIFKSFSLGGFVEVL